MKILYVNFAMDFIVRKKNFEIMIIKELQKLEHQITIVITDLDTSLRSNTRFSDPNQKSIEALENPIDMEGIPVFVLHCSLPKLGMYCPNATKFAKSIIKNYDLVHIANAYHHPGIVFSKIAYEYNIPYVFSAYATLQPETRSYKKRQKCLIDKLYTKKILRHASALHSVGELETQEYIKFGADAKKIFRIDPAISLENFEIKQRTDIFNKIRLEKDDEYLLFLGRIDKRKKIELILEAFAQINKIRKDLVLVVAGSGSDSYEQELKQLVKQIGIEERVRFIGKVIGNEKLELLESAKLFIHTSYGDIHPVAVQEALVFGIPVIITKTNDFPEIKEYEAGMFVDPNVDSLFKGLHIMLDDENKLSFYSNNAKKVIMEKFLLKNQVKKYEEMFRYAIENNPYSHTIQTSRMK